MPWFKVDDKFHSHPKVMELPPSAVGIWTLAGTWCADYLTDGEIKLGQIKRLGGTQRDATRLVEAGLWEPVEGGYRFRDWHDYQPTKQSVDAEREASRERQRKRREEREKKRRDSSGVTPRSQRDTGVTHEPVTDEFVTPVPDPVPGVPKGTHNHSSTADADGPGDQMELIVDEPPGPSEQDLFDAFWAEYPRKDGKKQARAKFTQALKRAEAQQIIDGAHRYNVDPNRVQEYTKQATTWLNGDHWEDPPLPPRGGQQSSAYDQRQARAVDIIRRRLPQQGPPPSGGELE